MCNARKEKGLYTRIVNTRKVPWNKPMSVNLLNVRNIGSPRRLTQLCVFSFFSISSDVCSPPSVNIFHTGQYRFWQKKKRNEEDKNDRAEVLPVAILTFRSYVRVHVCRARLISGALIFFPLE